ncbi:peptide deformylase [Spirochaetia bacterium]|nr:peptide deformylase [Spirochaetia bacterium]
MLYKFLKIVNNLNIMQVIKLGGEALREKTTEVKKFDDELRALCAEMFNILHLQKGIGLACPQVGVLKRMFVIHIESDKPRVFINPSIVSTSEKTSEFEEGCLSIPGVYAEIIRPSMVRVQAWNERGRPFTLDASGILARCIQHEYDHLQGILFIDKLSQAKRDRLIAKYEKIKSKKIKVK